VTATSTTNPSPTSTRGEAALDKALDGALVSAVGARVWRGEGSARRVVVDGLDLVVAPRRIHALVGDNGAGKSSVLQAILELLPSTIAVAAPTIGYAPQRLLPPTHLPLTVADLCALPARGRRVDVDAVLDAAGLAGRVPRRRALSSLSGGELARVLTALAVLPRPALCLLDEPSASVDAASRSVVDALVQRARDDGAGVLLVSHDERQVAALADVVTRLQAPEERA
jgi:zinc transport system ATP-binding protein